MKWFYLLVWISIIVCVFTSEIPNSCHNIHEYEDSVYSQNGEDGIIIYLLNLIGMKTKSFVEFGVEDGVQCNTRVLREKLNYDGLSMDGGHFNPDINLMKEFITEANILDLFEKYSIPLEFDVLSIDIDMFDLWVLVRLLRDGLYRPRIIIVETNPTLCMSNPKDRKSFNMCNSLPLTVNHPNLSSADYMWDLTRYSGANPKAFATIGKLYGYEMVYCERCGVNCFLVLASELPPSCIAPSATATGSGMDARVPYISYPCFGVSSSGAAYPGHLLDPKKRSVMMLSDPVVQKIAGGELTVEDVMSNQYSCEVGGQGWGRDWCKLIDLDKFNTNSDRLWFGSRNAAVSCSNALDGSMAPPTSAPTSSSLMKNDWIKLSNVIKQYQASELAGELHSFMRDVFHCSFHHAAEEGCSLSSGVFFNAGVELVQLYVGGGAVQDVLMVVSAYNNLWLSSQMCPNCIHAPYHMHSTGSGNGTGTGTLQHLLFDYIQLHGVRLDKQQPFDNQYLSLTPQDIQTKNETRIVDMDASASTSTSGYGAYAYEGSIPVEYRLLQEGMVNQYLQYVSFHMCDDITQISLSFCRSISPSGEFDDFNSSSDSSFDDSTSTTADSNVIGMCVADMVERIKVEANRAILPGLTFPLLFTTEDSLNRLQNTVIYHSKWKYSEDSDRNSPRELVLRSYGCINHLVVDMTKEIDTICSLRR